MDLKKGFVGPGMIKGLIISLVFLVVLLSIAPQLIHTGAVSVQGLATEYNNSTLYGTGASAIGTQIDDWTGYFWVLGPLVLCMTVILGVFAMRRGR